MKFVEPLAGDRGREARVQHGRRLPLWKRRPASQPEGGARGTRPGRCLGREVWESEVVPLLKNPHGLRPIAVFEELCRRHPA